MQVIPDQAAPIDQLWWMFLTGTLVALILSAAFIASMIIQQRRYVTTTRQFGGRLLLAQEEERAWVARELHDDLIQRVAMLGQELTELERAGAGSGEPLRLAGIREELHDLAGEIRRIAHRMHPAVLDHLGLPAALLQLGAEFGAQGLEVHVETAVSSDEVPSAVATCLYRVAQ
ncbi:MAG TPA: histidine kinase, partial [Gemmatimonadales bacterium]|nr:histidine kinase [Gemmatimonadales bacterium]